MRLQQWQLVDDRRQPGGWPGSRICHLGTYGAAAGCTIVARVDDIRREKARQDESAL
jgi:hypothetical protein